LHPCPTKKGDIRKKMLEIEKNRSKLAKITRNRKKLLKTEKNRSKMEKMFHQQANN
jgi:hypothetical protein